jgi:hypothetical protein
MASVSSFPTIKHVRSFIIQGVGSGGDYHNVQFICLSIAMVMRYAKQIRILGERRSLARGQLDIDSNGSMGTVPCIENQLGYQCFGFVLR